MTVRRDVPATVQSALDAGTAIAPCNMVFLDFVGDPTYFHDSIGPITWDGHTWIGVGNRGSVSPVLEETEGKAKELGVQLTGIDGTVDSDLMNAARSMAYDERTVQFLIGFRSIVTGAIIDTTELIYGVMRRMDIVEGQQGADSLIQIAVEDEISLLNETKGLYYDQSTVRQKLGLTSSMFLHTPRLPLLNFKLGASRGTGQQGRNDRDNTYDYNDVTDFF